MTPEQEKRCSESWSDARCPDLRVWKQAYAAAIEREVPSLEVTACYFPGKGEVELTWECKDTGNRASLLAKVTEEEGSAIARTVMSCVYHQAVAREVPRWRPIETAPKDSDLLLVCDKLTGFQSIVCLTADSIPMWTHWQPLPEPPKEGE